jgi:hypothetical protein
MTHALAMFVGAIMFRARTEPDRHRYHDDDEISLTRVGLMPRRPAPGDPGMVEDDYFRLLNQPRD